MGLKLLELLQLVLCLLNLVEISCEMTILHQLVEIHIFGQSLHILCGYCLNIKLISRGFQYVSAKQGLSQDLETGCLKLAISKFWGVQIFRGYHNILRFQS